MSRQLGTLKWFNKTRGYGFIIPDEGEKRDIFVSFKWIEGWRKLLFEGERLEFEIEEGPTGPLAKHVTKVKEINMGRTMKQNWTKTADNTWSCTAHRGYTAQVVYSAGVGYTLTITGTGAPAAVAYTTLKLAKAAFSKFLRTKS
jgi:CspA family cold shock protein